MAKYLLNIDARYSYVEFMSRLSHLEECLTDPLPIDELKSLGVVPRDIELVHLIADISSHPIYDEKLLKREIHITPCILDEDDEEFKSFQNCFPKEIWNELISSTVLKEYIDPKEKLNELAEELENDALEKLDSPEFIDYVHNTLDLLSDSNLDETSIDLYNVIKDMVDRFDEFVNSFKKFREEFEDFHESKPRLKAKKRIN